MTLPGRYPCPRQLLPNSMQLCLLQTSTPQAMRACSSSHGRLVSLRQPVSCSWTQVLRMGLNLSSKVSSRLAPEQLISPSANQMCRHSKQLGAACPGWDPWVGTQEGPIRHPVTAGLSTCRAFQRGCSFLEGRLPI